MTVNELRKKLEKCKPDAKVLIYDREIANWAPDPYYELEDVLELDRVVHLS